MLHNVGILYHPKRASAETLAKDVLKALADLRVSGWLCSAWEEEEARAQIEGTDLIISVGGDGTILRAARVAIPWPVPILGINLGRLGFMTELEPKEVFQKLPTFVAGEGWIEERTMLRAILHYYHQGLKALEEGRSLESVISMKVREKIAQMKYVPEEDPGVLEAYVEIDRAFQGLSEK